MGLECQDNNVPKDASSEHAHFELSAQKPIIISLFSFYRWTKQVPCFAHYTAVFSKSSSLPNSVVDCLFFVLACLPPIALAFSDRALVVVSAGPSPPVRDSRLRPSTNYCLAAVFCWVRKGKVRSVMLVFFSSNDGRNFRQEAQRTGSMWVQWTCWILYYSIRQDALSLVILRCQV